MKIRERKKTIKIVLFIDRVDLGASIDSIHWGKINPDDLDEETVNYLTDNKDSLKIENLEELDESSQKEAVIKKFLADGICWATDYNSQLLILDFYVAAIKGKRNGTNV